MPRLAIVTTHPIQYNAPLFRLISERGRIELKVFYTWGQTVKGEVYDPGFGKAFTWDIPLLQGYSYEAIENIAKHPGTGSFQGIRNKDLLHRIEVFKPDFIMVYGWSNLSHLSVLRRFQGRVKLIFKGDSTLLDETNRWSLKKMLRRLFLSWIYRHVDLAIYNGLASREYFQTHGLKEEQLVYVPHVVDNDRFADSDYSYENEAQAWRERLGIPSDSFVFLFAGKLEAKKDPQILLDAFKRLNDSRLYLIFVGNGILEPSLKVSAKDFLNVRFLDFQNQIKMPVVYRLADVFVLPSRGPGETWGLSVNEAMASNRPVIVSNACGCHLDLVSDKKNGYVFQKGNVAALTEIMKDIYCNSNILDMKYEAGKTIAKYNMQKVANVIESLVKNLSQQNQS